MSSSTRSETYGAPRIHAELRQAHGVRVGRKRVARLMRQLGLAGRLPAREAAPHDDPAIAAARRRRTWSVAASPPSGPNELWLADITYLPTRRGLALPRRRDGRLQPPGRRLVDARRPARPSWSCDALAMALARRRPEPGLVHHSDRGLAVHLARLRPDAARGRHRVSHGLGGDCYDNAVARASSPRSRTSSSTAAAGTPATQARLAVFSYIETFYNSIRLHSSLGYLSPAAFEERAAALGRPPATAGAASLGYDRSSKVESVH